MWVGVGMATPNLAFAQGDAASVETPPPGPTSDAETPTPPPSNGAASDASPQAPVSAAEKESPRGATDGQDATDAAPDGPHSRRVPGEAAPSGVVVLLFLENSGPFGAGITVETDEGHTALTTADGAARLPASEGKRTLILTIPPQLLPPGSTEPKRVDLGTIVVAAGESTQVLVNLKPDGEVAALDVEGVGTAEAEATQERKPEEEVVIEYGFIAGRVVSSEEGTPVVGARVLVRGVDAEAETDADGRFRIRTPVGIQSVSVIHTRYSLQTTNDVEVTKDESTRVDIELTPAATQLDDVVITAPYIEGGVASVMAERRKATTVQDGLGSDDIAKTPDGSASSATRRIVGASVVGGQFLFVRGLGGRYSNVRLNGVPMPSTDPDLPGFQLDLFPTSLLSGLTISKTFSPDIPGDFAGGSLNVETRSFPEEFLLKVSIRGTYDTLTTFKDVLDYPGGSTDWLAMDDGTRALPDRIPAEQVRSQTRFDPDVGYSSEEIGEMAGSFPNNWKRGTTLGLPNLSLGLSVGDTIKTSAGDIGYFFTLGYKHRQSRQLSVIRGVRLTDGEVSARDELDQETGTQEAQIGTLGTVSYAPSDKHRVSVVSMLTQTSTDTTRNVNGFSDREGGDVDLTSYQFVERQLLFNQLLGEHEQLADFLDIRWQLNTSRVRRDQPDSRTAVYRQDPDGLRFWGIQGSGEHLFSVLEQEDYGGGLDLKAALWSDAALKTGYMGRSSNRSFAARRFQSVLLENEDTLLPPEQLLDPATAGERWTIQEISTLTDGYQADQDLHAAYLMLETPIVGKLTGMGGVRAERFHQAIDAVAPFRVPERDADDEQDADDDGPAISGDRLDIDYLTAASLSYAFTDEMTLRAAYGGTVARPQIRELSPFIIQDYVRRRTIRGNPLLERTFIHNFDLRWEVFPSPTEVFAVSLFYKLFESPIEPSIDSSNGDIKFINIKGAKNYGAEFEARVGLGLLSTSLEQFSFLANLALIQSEVQFTEEQKALSTSSRRPLAGQSPFVANLGLGFAPEDSGFSTYLYYNVFGRRISEAGSLGVPDVYEQPFHALDYTAFYKPNDHWSFGLYVQNLLLQGQRFKQGPVYFQETDPNFTLGLNAGWTY